MSGSGSRTISGSTVNTFYDYGGGTPLIQNDSGNTQTINFPIADGNAAGVNALDIKANSGNLAFGGAISASGGARNIFPQGAANITFNGAINDGSSAVMTVTKLGTGTSFYEAANNYSGNTYISAGTIQVDSGGSANNSTIQIGDTSGSAAATFKLGSASGGQSLSSPIVVRSGSSGTKTISSLASSGNNTLAGNITLNDSVTASSVSGGNLNLSGTSIDFQSGAYIITIPGDGNTTISANFINVANGAAKIAKSGAGTLTINGNTSTSASHLMFNHSGGIINISNANAIAVPTDTSYPDKFNFLDSATLQVTANSFTLGNYTDASHNCGFRIQGGKTATLDIASGSTLSIDGQIIDVPSSGSGALTKTSAGTLVLDQANSYSGGTTVSGGTLLVNNTSGSGTGTGSVSVNGGTLGGNGTISGAVTVGSSSSATLSPGSAGSGSIGTLTLSSTLTLGSSSTASMEINKSGMTDTADKVAASGAVSYGGALNVTATGDTLASGDSFTLFTGSGFSGWFGSVTVPTLAAGISWDTNKLATNGVLDIYTFTTTSLSLSTPTNTAAVISAAKLANHASSSRAGAYPTGWTADVTTPSHGTASVDSGSGDLTYTPTSGYSGSDSFTVTFHDGHGWQTMAVSVTVGTGNGQSPNLLVSGTIDGNFVLQFAGIPGDAYTVETNSVLDGSLPWVKLANYTTPANGVIFVTNALSGAGSLYYRTVYPSY